MEVISRHLTGNLKRVSARILYDASGKKQPAMKKKPV
jgi:hypothetical protein